MAQVPTVDDLIRQFCELANTPGLAHQSRLPIEALPDELYGLLERFCAKTKLDPNGCLNWTGAVAGGGYGQFGLNGKVLRAHRVAFEFAFGPIPEGLLVRHRCDNRRCVSPAHLITGSHLDNMDDMTSALRGRSRLTNRDVATVIGLLLLGRSAHDVAAEYGVSDGLVKAIKRRERRPGAIDRELEKSLAA